MTVIENFLGHQVEIPDDLRYDVNQGLWGRRVDQTIVFGLTQPFLVLAGGVKDLDRLVEESQMVQKGETILFAITGKLLYLEAPVAGSVQFNRITLENPSRIVTDPYDQGWLFLIQPDGVLNQNYQALLSPQNYLEKLRHSDGLKNPEGIKGGVSGICKAVYSGIGEQKI
jgi:glycine cleavage system H lipoate-binding protein